MVPIKSPGIISSNIAISFHVNVSGIKDSSIPVNYYHYERLNDPSSFVTCVNSIKYYIAAVIFP